MTFMTFFTGKDKDRCKAKDGKDNGNCLYHISTPTHDLKHPQDDRTLLF